MRVFNRLIVGILIAALCLLPAARTVRAQQNSTSTAASKTMGEAGIVGGALGIGAAVGCAASVVCAAVGAGVAIGIGVLTYLTADNGATVNTTTQNGWPVNPDPTGAPMPGSSGGASGSWDDGSGGDGGGASGSWDDDGNGPGDAAMPRVAQGQRQTTQNAARWQDALCRTLKLSCVE
jgi:hypothetical protein